MCLLVTQLSNSPALPEVWLRDFHASNSDGVGVMYVEGQSLVIEKCLPKSADDFVNFYYSHIAGKDCAFHLRMRTHGATDLENCHPYEVLNAKDHGLDLWLMHNGILHTDNKKDTTKSDTWHYIRDYLRPMLANNPDFFVTPEFQDLIESHIGSSNKFVLMDNQNRLVTINESAGVYWGGLWLSNTYAWTASTTATKTYNASPELALEQVQELPEKKTTYTTKTYNAPRWQNAGGWDYESHWENQSYGLMSADPEEDIYNALDDLIEMGLQRAGSLSIYQARSFVRTFGLDSFLDIVAMTMESEIDEDWFVRLMSDFRLARETLPFLIDEEKAIEKEREMAYQ
jgi:predicted glutamine amidotransferase